MTRWLLLKRKKNFLIGGEAINGIKYTIGRAFSHLSAHTNEIKPHSKQGGLAECPAESTPGTTYAPQRKIAWKEGVSSLHVRQRFYSFEGFLCLSIYVPLWSSVLRGFFPTLNRNSFLSLIQQKSSVDRMIPHDSIPYSFRYFMS